MKKLAAIMLALTLTMGVMFWAFTSNYWDTPELTLSMELGELSLESSREAAYRTPSSLESSRPAAGQPRSLLLDRSYVSGESGYITGVSGLFAISSSAQASSPYAEHPRAFLATGVDPLDLPVIASNYAHRGMGGSFIQSRPQVRAPVAVSGWGQNRLPELSFSRLPGQLQITITCAAEGVTHRLTNAQAREFQLQPNRTYEVRVLARYESAQYTGTVNFGYTLTTGALAMRFEISGNTTDLGEALVLRARNLPSDTRVTAETSLPNTPVFFDDGRGGAVALLPVSIHAAPGEHFVEMRAGGVSERFPIRVLATEFEVQRFNIDRGIAERTVNSAAANAEFRQVIHPLREVGDSVRHWQGRFGQPVNIEDGRITTPFAVIRFVNGVGPSRHASIDIALPQGTPVYSPAGGRVMFAGYLQLTGNTVVIEHGFGLKTWYYHLDTLDVETDDMVGRGQRIGAVGTTGFSTGPHLCYGMSIFGVFINPDTAANTDIFNWVS